MNKRRKKQQAGGNPWRQYEAAKRALQAKGLAPHEYERRVRALARALGV